MRKRRSSRSVSVRLGGVPGHIKVSREIAGLGAALCGVAGVTASRPTGRHAQAQGLPLEASGRATRRHAPKIWFLRALMSLRSGGVADDQVVADGPDVVRGDRPDSVEADVGVLLERGVLDAPVCSVPVRDQWAGAV